MKVKLALLGLLSGATLSAMANQVHIQNVSQDKTPLAINYQIAHQDANQQVILSEIKTAELSNSVDIPVNLGTYRYAGIVLDGVNGHEIPDTYKQFLVPGSCSVATDLIHPQGRLNLFYQIDQDEHGKIACST
ncbi:MAG: hypothetical protein A3E87_07370 [Gammaproteobacteria bacterium RIFCSPHIGHO2_12_FULL_35_23]|nr:MAG: hypothetical protein A3E87_07370 [Gammaproteobacteria bacterium RIFCSPHIGHO2_12_FULL_35_23]